MESGRWKQWEKLKFEQKIIWLKAAICLVIIKTGLQLLPFGWFRKVFKWMAASGQKRSTEKDKVLSASWAVRSAAYHLPLSLLCLPQALSVKYLLRHEKDLKVQIGVLINQPGDLEAHAWVEWKGEVVLGDLPEKHFQPIWVWE